MQVRRLGKHRDFGRDFRGALPCSVIWERGAHCCVESREARRIERLPERMGGATPRNFRGEPGCGRRLGIFFFLVNVCKKHTGPVLYHIKVVHSTEPIQAPTRRVQRGQLSTPSYTKDLAKTEKCKQAREIFCACQSRRSPPSDTAMAIDRAG